MDTRELRILRTARQDIGWTGPLFDTEAVGELVLQSRRLEEACLRAYGSAPDEAGLLGSAAVHMAYQTAISAFLRRSDPGYFARFQAFAADDAEAGALLGFYSREFPSAGGKDEPARCFLVTEVARANPAMAEALGRLLSSPQVPVPASAPALLRLLNDGRKAADGGPVPGGDLLSFLLEPARRFPSSLKDQLSFIARGWSAFLGEDLFLLLERAALLLKEDFRPAGPSGPPESVPPDFSSEAGESEMFSSDQSWMPRVVMMAKNTLVWLDQLSKARRRPIRTLDQIPDEELDLLRERGFNALWLIGLWERSPASKRIKVLCGNPEAEASAYSIKSYAIASSLGGGKALLDLRERCARRGIRLASDMVPNHTGLDSDWVRDHKERFVRQSFKPFPAYSFTGPSLSGDPDFEVRIEDHYLTRTDAAVVFERRDSRTGEVDYIYHGNDGTSMPWNDTAQLDFINKETREAVIQQILAVARLFPIIRFDAAMTLAKRHIRRLWRPAPGAFPVIAGRSLAAMTDAEFEKAIPVEFWREVVDRVAAEAPDTLLLAEAFWMMEGYFVRTLGMHRVYNSAFMNMLKNEENAKYRASIKNTILFDPEILKRHVNFMSNPDEESAAVQFGKGDKYFCVCALLATMPGLPMFGHGQIEGLTEKYGMEYSRAYRDEAPDEALAERHKALIFPLLKRRALFSGCERFNIFDAAGPDGTEESVYAFANGDGDRAVLVLCNNRCGRVRGRIRESAPKLVRLPGGKREIRSFSLAEALGLPAGGQGWVLARTFDNKGALLVPADEIRGEGLEVRLEGYQSLVFTSIETLEDEDGILAAIRARHGSSLIEDFDKEFADLALAPARRSAAALLASCFTPLLKKLLQGRASRPETERLAGALRRFYDAIRAPNPYLARRSIAPRPPAEEETRSLLASMSRTAGRRFFKTAFALLPSCFEVFASMLVLKPFVGSLPALGGLAAFAARLLPEEILGAGPRASALGALACLEDRRSIEELLEDKGFRTLIGANLYQDAVWFDADAFLDAVLARLAARSFSERRPAGLECERAYALWLEKVHGSKYVLDNLTREG